MRSLVSPADVGPISSTSACDARQPVSSSSSRIAESFSEHVAVELQIANTPHARVLFVDEELTEHVAIDGERVFVDKLRHSLEVQRPPQIAIRICP